MSDCDEHVCRPATASMYSGVMEGGGEEVAAWLTSPVFESRLFTSFPCTNIVPSAANQVCLVLHPVPLPLPPSTTPLRFVHLLLTCMKLVAAAAAPRSTHVLPHPYAFLLTGFDLPHSCWASISCLLQGHFLSAVLGTAGGEFGPCKWSRQRLHG